MMQFVRLRLALPLIVCGLAAGEAAEMHDTGAMGVFYGRGLVKAVEPGTGWLTLANNDILGCMPSMEMTFRVRAPEVSQACGRATRSTSPSTAANLSSSTRSSSRTLSERSGKDISENWQGCRQSRARARWTCSGDRTCSLRAGPGSRSRSSC
jgi:Cu/Ag efflux protein CusF